MDFTFVGQFVYNDGTNATFTFDSLESLNSYVKLCQSEQKLLSYHVTILKQYTYSNDIEEKIS